jgi:hypothetical protein
MFKSLKKPLLFSYDYDVIKIKNYAKYIVKYIINTNFAQYGP